MPTKIEAYESELTSFWSDRDTMMKLDRAKTSLARPKPIPNFVQVTLNKPKVLYDTAVSILSSFEPVLRLPWEAPDQTDEVRTKLSKAERFLIGAWREFNRHQQSTGRPGGSWMYELAYWACSGYISWMPYIEEVNGKVRFTCPFFDPLTVYPLFTNDGMPVCLRRYYIPIAAAKRMADSKGWTYTPKMGESTLTCKVVSLWEVKNDGVYNTVTIQGQEAKPETLSTFEEIPLKIIPVAGTVESPTSEGDRGPIARRGENIIGRNRETFETQNKVTSFAFKLMQDITYPGILDFTESGEPKLVKEDIGSGKIHTRKVEERVELLEHASIKGLQSLMVILNSLNLDEQKGGLPSIVYGGLPFEISGFMGSQLFAAVKYRLAPYLEAERFVISWTATEILRQFRVGGFGKVSLATTESPRDTKKLSKGESFMEEFSPSDIPPMTYVDVTIPLETMVDKAQQMSWARQALAKPQLMSRETLWENEFGIQDIDQEHRRITDDEVSQLEGVQIIHAMERLKSIAFELRQRSEEGDQERAQAYEDYAAWIGQQAPWLQGKTEQPGGGPGPTELPAEFGAAGVSPDVTGAAGGVPPPGGKPGARTRGAASRKAAGM